MLHVFLLFSVVAVKFVGFQNSILEMRSIFSNRIGNKAILLACGVFSNTEVGLGPQSRSVKSHADLTPDLPSRILLNKNP